MEIKEAIKLKKVIIYKYKSFIEPQEVDIEDDITVLVGKNESGKTAFLECLAKSNYFQEDDKFKFHLQLDYPRKELKSKEREENLKAIKCVYKLPKDIFLSIEKEFKENIWNGSKEISIEIYFDKRIIVPDIDVNSQRFFLKFNINCQDEDIQKEILNINSLEDLNQIKTKYKDSINNLDEIKPFIIDSKVDSEVQWDNFIKKYIYLKIIKPRIPKFIYYDEYYQLPSDICLENLIKNKDKLTDDLKTAKAFVELSSMSVEKVLQSDYEIYKAELEATTNAISDELFLYWKQNNNLQIELDIQLEEDKVTKKDSEHILKLRVRNLKTKMTLPLRSRSKGFNWFFSFIVWFKKIQEDPSSSYILLLDEPGLNLHASAQKDLLHFIDDLGKNYQVIYTTHSPFMVEVKHLNRVRTVFDDFNEKDKGSIITDTVQQKDPDTLFPLQAALGYDIAQNLFISPKNLLVEGVSDLLYLETISEFLKSKEREGLNQDITIVPTGGLNKVATFISLLRGSKLEVVCLLDSFEDQKNKAKLDEMQQEKIIKSNKIMFFHEFLENRKKADIEDMFLTQEYLHLFNQINSETCVQETKLNKDIEGIIKQINDALGKNRFNHYKPAYYFSIHPDFCKKLSESTLNHFEMVFKKVNKLFKKVES